MIKQWACFGAHTFPHVNMTELYNARKISCPVYDPKLCTMFMKQVLVYNSALETRTAYFIDRRLRDAMVNKGQKGDQVIHARNLVLIAVRYMFLHRENYSRTDKL